MKKRTLEDVYKACLSDLVMQAPEELLEEMFSRKDSPEQKPRIPSVPPEEVIRQVGDAALKKVMEKMKQEEKTIVDDEAFPDFGTPKKTTGRKTEARSKRRKKR